MDRRSFFGVAASLPATLTAAGAEIPQYRVVTRYKPQAPPVHWAGRVCSVHDPRSIDEGSEKIGREAVREMLRAGMASLTGDNDARDAWARFFAPADVVGIKINASGAPGICSSPELVGEIAANLTSVGVKPENIWVHERFKVQVDTVPYASFLPAGAHVATADAYLGYDPFTYVEVSFFGEDDTRSNLVRLVSEKLTKIINVPNMKDHSASGVTGCLKNIAYGEFSNVARSHQYAQTHTLSFIGTLAAVEPLRSRTVLHVMDGIKGVWHGGPFSPSRKFRFYPKQLMLGTDPVAMDRLLLEIIEQKRKEENAISVWDRSEKTLSNSDRDFRMNPNVNRFLREPGHIEYAAKLGLGVWDHARIERRKVRL